MCGSSNVYHQLSLPSFPPGPLLCSNDPRIPPSPFPTQYSDCRSRCCIIVRLSRAPAECIPSYTILSLPSGRTQSKLRIDIWNFLFSYSRNLYSKSNQHLWENYASFHIHKHNIGETMDCVLSAMWIESHNSRKLFTSKTGRLCAVNG